MRREEPARELARGRWHGLLGRYLDERALSGKHTACPMCGGRDRFRMDDKEGSGSWICSHCGAGDGFHLLEALNGWSFQQAAEYVEQNVRGIIAKKHEPARSEDDVRASLRGVWEKSFKIKQGDPAWLYLNRRCGISDIPSGLRFHPDMAYRHDDGSITRHPGMLAQVLGQDGTGLTIHRTYLGADGTKAVVPKAKKLMTPLRKLENAAVRLGKPVDGWLGVAEGIETALSAARKHGVVVWACVSAGLLRTFRPPQGIKLLAIYGDNDTSFTGQAAAYELARAVTNIGVECQVCIPERVGTDWADE